ncbi:YeaO [Parelusimicrobium proximum]|uniref:DUF488 domain-containing protein n=1 Tax=Parelusimicrobium proximum TaxID=3228953 RepID=UPI003D165B69
MLKIKRAYDAPSKDDGQRILIDRLWPRGMSKEREHLDAWDKEITPSTELRKAFDHEPDKFEWFKKEYIKELNKNPHTPEFIKEIKALMKTGNVTLIYGAKDPQINHAVILRDYILGKI